MPAFIKTLRDYFGNQVYPRTISSAVYHTDGKLFSEKMDELGSTVSGMTNTVNSKATATTIKATLGTSWSGSAAPYSQKVTVSGILSTDNPVTDIVLSGTMSTDKAILEAWGLISRITTANGSITAYCYDEKPTVSIPIQMKVVR